MGLHSSARVWQGRGSPRSPAGRALASVPEDLDALVSGSRGNPVPPSYTRRADHQEQPLKTEGPESDFSGGWVTTVCTGSGRPGAKGSERARFSSCRSWREVPSSPCWDDQGSARRARQSLRTADPDGPRDGRALLLPPPPAQPCAWDGPRLAALEYRPWTFHDLRINGPCTAFPVSCIFQKETFKNVENVLAVAPKKERKKEKSHNRARQG